MVDTYMVNIYLVDIDMIAYSEDQQIYTVLVNVHMVSIVQNSV